MAGKPKEDYTEEEIGYMREVALSPEKFNAMSVFEKREFLIDYIHAFPEKHNQRKWITGDAETDTFYGDTTCGTAACLAGWAALFSGAKPVVEYSDRHGYSYVRSNDGDGAKGVKPLAEEILDLNHEESYVLFHANNSREQIREFINNLNEGKSFYFDE
jgi:hypothetical protein